MKPSWRERILAKLKHQFRRWLGLGALLFTVGFLLLLLAQNANQLREFNDWPSYLGVAGIGFLLYPVSLGIQAFIWQMILVRLGQVTGGWWDIEIYAYTHLIRRLPGAVWYLAGRVAMYRTRGVKASITLAASGLEWLLLLITAASIYAAFGLTRGAHLVKSLILLLLLITLGAWGLVRLLKASDQLQRWPILHRRLQALTQMPLPQTTDLGLWLILYALCYIIGGGILLLLARGIIPDSAVSLGTATRIWAVAGGVGFFLSAIIPAGLGVRELTLTMLLSPFMPTAAAILVAVMFRLLFIGGDLIWGLILWIIARLVQYYQRK
jgi:glycosyltransferase 2 family protein